MCSGSFSVNRFAIWLIYIWLWWRPGTKSDTELRLAACRYWMRLDWLIRFGVLTTAILLASAFLFSLSETCSIGAGNSEPVCEMRLIAFWYAPANEVGDTLAGLAGALAFLWLVLTVFLQGKELRAQRQELQLTRIEMKGQSAATQDMAAAMKQQSEAAHEQIAYLRLQNEREKRKGASEDFDGLCKLVEKILGSSDWEKVHWLAREWGGDGEVVQEFGLGGRREVFSADDAGISRLYSQTLSLVTRLDDEIVETQLPPKYACFRRLLEAVKEINDLRHDLSPDRLAEFNGWKLDRVLVFLLKIDEDQYWSGISRRKRKK
ncbi:hypothetical protein TRM7615_03952 [Falsiruegeria mediterranea M17]|uniref:Uncharacterized protein n=1 Tax=Falsiruegeria mediterranea M17 TaxID=1200281 RepID=A0A2R8CDF6_9RHOB|nr:hypothetical protein TRM7615_03952 [Falsiruegeria mediterranea M17]